MRIFLETFANRKESKKILLSSFFVAILNKTIAHLALSLSPQFQNFGTAFSSSYYPSL